MKRERVGGSGGGGDGGAQEERRGNREKRKTGVEKRERERAVGSRRCRWLGVWAMRPSGGRLEAEEAAETGAKEERRWKTDREREEIVRGERR